MADEVNSGSGEMDAATQHGDSRTERGRKLIARYRKGYRIGEQLMRLGHILKIFGYVLGSIAVLVAAAVLISTLLSGLGARGIGFSLLALLYGVLIVFGWYVGGAVVTGLGQLIVAALDGAVFNAPFLSDDDRASILSLD